MSKFILMVLSCAAGMVLLTGLLLLSINFARSEETKKTTPYVQPLDSSNYSGKIEGHTRGWPVELGKKVFKRKCKSCHAFDKNKVGPRLDDIWDKKAGSAEGFRYSKAFKESNIVWNACTLDSFLSSPKNYIKGTKMRFRGLGKMAERGSVIAYLRMMNENNEK